MYLSHSHRLSLKYEPGVDSPPSRSEKLRLSKSHEDLLGPFTSDLPQDTNSFSSKPRTPTVVAPNGALLYHRHSYHNIRDRRNTMTVPLSVQQSKQTSSSPQSNLHSPFKSTKSSKNLHVQLAVANPFEDGFGSGSPRSKKSSTLPKEMRADLPSSHSKRAQSESEEKARKNKSLVPWRSKHRKAQSLGGK